MKHRRQRGGWGILGSVATIVGILTAPLAGVAASPAEASVTVTSHFIWTTTSANTSAFVTGIDNGATNGQPNAILFVTPNDTPGGVCGCTLDPAPIGVIYNLFGGNRWAIYNEDESNMPVGAQFNVLVVQHASANVFVQVSTASNTTGDATSINSVQTNGKPTALLQVTQVASSSVQVNNHPIGVSYANNQAVIFNEDTASMPIGAHFNVMVGSSKSNGGKTYLQQTGFGSGSDSVVSNGRTNGNPNAVIFDTPNFDTAYIGGVFDTVPSGVAYVPGPTDRWAVAQQDGSAMGNGPAFNLLIFTA